MRVAIFSESPSDEVALRVFVGALLQVELEPVGLRLLLSAVASASPAMEAWLLQGRPDAPNEASWSLYLLTQPSRYDVKMKVRELKRRVYGVGKPPQARAQLVAESEARRISADWAGLAHAFPGGFGTMAKAISTWKPGLP